MASHILGYPRIGRKRELKFALESYWQGKTSQKELEHIGAQIRSDNWHAQKNAGLDYVTVGDFAWYDHVLNTSLLLGHLPARHRHEGQSIDLDTLFRVARGKAPTGCVCAAADMTKWFNTNYHYIVPEFEPGDTFALSWTQLFDEIKEAQTAGYRVKPVLLGPVSYLFLGKEKQTGFDRLSLLDKLLPVYQQVLDRLASLDIEWLQIDEPVLGLDLDPKWQSALVSAYQKLDSPVKLLLTSYFENIEDKLALLGDIEVQGIHIDLSAAPGQLDAVVNALPEDWVLSAGVINGRNVWRADLIKWQEQLRDVKKILGDRLWVASSCSLLHSPLDLELETDLDTETHGWFAFAKQKLEEVVLLGKVLSGDVNAQNEAEIYSQTIKARQHSRRVHNPEVKARLTTVSDALGERKLRYPERAVAQRRSLNLPLFPTTTIGSFPQTQEIRQQRSDFKAGRLGATAYRSAMEGHIRDAVQRQENIGLDVLVHGEAERNDMVEYFAEHLDGFVSTRFGWVQSYGSRCVKPAVVIGDVSRHEPISVSWSAYAQSLTEKPVKGMLTGPVTILAWTFPREDISRQSIAEQIALALRDEVADLQNAGIKIIQIDEPAIREGMPLRKEDWQAYLHWAVRAFRISAASATEGTQIHTHMCYSEFNDIIESVAELDADVITIETSRSDMELLKAFDDFSYPNEIGPGVYDIHSPNVPEEGLIVDRLLKALKTIPKERLWVNPDCGLKTRNWEETEASLRNLVSAARTLRGID